MQLQRLEPYTSLLVVTRHISADSVLNYSLPKQISIDFACPFPASII
jgi:hypothetical protein